ncbi:head-tail connector protein [Carboxylicivirga sp. RSCT41]|uniref:head-tail connector protein n=1 Tax=Carboxylicivirga agarovorans TaxID=3417570 RepID=UPI003D3382D6
MINKSINSYTLTVNELKQHLNIDIDYIDDDTYLQSLIEVATQHVSNLINSDIELTTNQGVSTDKDNLNGIFYTSPFVSISSLIVDGNNISTSGLSINEYYSHFEIEDIEAIESIEIEFITGYNTLPTPLRHAIIIYASDLYDTLRNDTVAGVGITTTKVVEALTAAYKRKYW